MWISRAVSTFRLTPPTLGMSLFTRDMSEEEENHLKESKKPSTFDKLVEEDDSEFITRVYQDRNNSTWKERVSVMFRKDPYGNTSAELGVIQQVSSPVLILSCDG